MRPKSIAATAFGLLALGTLSASSAGISLTPGFYAGTELITSTKGSCAPYAAGQSFPQEVYNPGPNATGYTVRSAFNYTEGSNHYVGLTVYSFTAKTPAAGVTSWTSSGTANTYYALNGKNQTTISAPFTVTETWTYIDVYTYYTTGSSVSGSCTIDYQHTRAFSGIK